MKPLNDLRTFSLNDPLNSNKDLRYGRSNRDNRWIRDYVIPYTNNDISDLKIYMQNKRESPNTEESLEELKQRNKAIEKAILNNKENEKQTEEDSLKRISKNKRKKDPSFLQSKSQKHTELSSAAALVNGNVNNAKLSWLNEAESPDEMFESDKSLNNIKNQDRSVILLRNKRTNLRNDLFNEREMNLYKQLTNVDDLIAQQAKLLHYDNTNNNKNVLSESEQVIKRKSPERRLFWIIEKESNNRSLSDNENKCFIVKKHQRRILQSYDEENLEEDFLTNEEDDSNRNEKIKVAKSCQVKNDERKLDYQKSPINRDENIIEENVENDKKDTLKVERDVENTSDNVKNPYEARVNMMIKQRIALRHKDEENHVRRKRYPLGIIEYYDYDEEMNERSRESQIIGDNDQNNNDQNENPLDSSFKLVDANLQESLNETLMKKKNEQAEEQEKEKKRKEKLKNKEPKQQFLVDLEQQARAKNENPSESLRSKVTFEGVAKGEDKSSQMDREKSFLNEAVQPSGQIRDEKSFVPACQTKWSNNRRKEQDENDQTMEEPNQEFVNIDKIVPKESLEYILRAPETLQREIVDVVFGDVKPIQLPEHEKKLDNVDQTRLENRVGSKKLDEKEYDDIDNVYDELKKLYDWEDNENKNGPRLKGDQRMHLDASEDDLEIKTNTNDNNNNNNNSNNTSESNYLALKKTDDLFKGGLEQSDIFEERSSNKSQNHHHHQNMSNNYAGNIEWKVIPIQTHAAIRSHNVRDRNVVNCASL
ncbi:PREDICTED: protein PFC0760c-like [Polistes canadensis]|uniref:protein PFC0760c-like n=1 Tax=Polistes canadensis TaxID=91411 RepID=UPI0007190341|nr:PREDICTED: protein PFC0760c-like [Polistes canadensis]